MLSAVNILEIVEAKNILETWKIRMDNKLLSVDGRELPAPILHFKDRTSIQQSEPTFEILPKNGIYDAVLQLKLLLFIYMYMHLIY